MSLTKSLAFGMTLAMLLAVPALAVTIENKSGEEIRVGIDYGHKEEVKEVPAKNSITFDCKQGCGVTGPWGFSWMAKGDDVISTNGTSLVEAES